MLRTLRYPHINFLLGMHLILWVFIICITKTGLDSYGDMIENYAWGQVFSWGSFKHPPLFSWITRIWFYFFSESDFSYYVLSYTNVGIGLWGIINLARLFQKEENDTQQEYLWWVLAFSVLAFPYANLAMKFNADTVLLSLWPWTAYFFILSACGQSAHPYWTAFSLGVMGAASILGKYYSFVFLLSLFLTSLSRKDYRRWYFSPYPYVALLIAVVLLLPHVLWLIRMNFPFTHYIEGKMFLKNDLIRLFSFIFSGGHYFIFPWCIYGYFYYQSKKHKEVPPRIKYSNQTLQTLILLTTLPAMITFIFGGFDLIKLTVHWAIPIWFTLPILMAALLRPVINKDTTRFFWWILRLIWIGVILLSFGYLLNNMRGRGERTFLARKEMAYAIQEEWQKQLPQKSLFKWVAGTWSEPAALAFYLPTHPRALPSVPNQQPALVNPEPDWETENGVLICHPAPLGKGLSGYERCLVEAEMWLKIQQKPIIKTDIIYESQDWRAIYPPTRRVTVYWYIAN